MSCGPFQVQVGGGARSRGKNARFSCLGGGVADEEAGVPKTELEQRYSKASALSVCILYIYLFHLPELAEYAGQPSEAFELGVTAQPANAQEILYQGLGFLFCDSSSKVQKFLCQGTWIETVRREVVW